MRMTRQSLMVFSNDEGNICRVKDEDDAEDDDDGEKKAICRGRKMRHK